MIFNQYKIKIKTFSDSHKKTEQKERPVNGTVTSTYKIP